MTPHWPAHAGDADAAATKAQRDAIADKVVALLDSWDEYTAALVYLTMYRRGFRHEHAETVVRRGPK